MTKEKTVGSSLNCRILKWIAVFFYAFLIFYLSSRPVPPVDLPPFFMADKVAHFVAYGIFGFLLYKALTEESWAKRKWLLAFIIATGYGVTDELHQYYVPSREADLLDLLADAAGSGTGAYFAASSATGRTI